MALKIAKIKQPLTRTVNKRTKDMELFEVCFSPHSNEYVIRLYKDKGYCSVAFFGLTLTGEANTYSSNTDYLVRELYPNEKVLIELVR